MDDTLQTPWLSLGLSPLSRVLIVTVSHHLRLLKVFLSLLWTKSISLSLNISILLRTFFESILKRIAFCQHCSFSVQIVFWNSFNYCNRNIFIHNHHHLLKIKWWDWKIILVCLCVRFNTKDSYARPPVKSFLVIWALFHFTIKTYKIGFLYLLNFDLKAIREYLIWKI